MSKYKMNDKVYYWSDTLSWVDVCYSCTGQNIIEVDTKGYDSQGNYLMCKDCESTDVGTIPSDEVLGGVVERNLE